MWGSHGRCINLNTLNITRQIQIVEHSYEILNGIVCHLRAYHFAILVGREQALIILHLNFVVSRVVHIRNREYACAHTITMVIHHLANIPLGLCLLRPIVLTESSAHISNRWRTALALPNIDIEVVTTQHLTQ